MDKLRDIRFITPPFFFLGSLFLGAWLNNQVSLDTINSLATQAVAAIGGVIVASLFPLGFIIAGFSMLCLRLLFFIFGKKNYQISISEQAWKRIWPTLHSDIIRTRHNEVDAAITFDHEILHKSIHDSNVRLWSAFNIAAHSCCSLALALIVGRFGLGISFTLWWIIFSVILFMLLLLTAVITWHEHMQMFEFQSSRIKDGYMPHSSNTNTQKNNENEVANS